MANVLNLITIGEKKYLVVDADPASSSGTEAEVGSLAVWDSNSDIGRVYLKRGPLDTEWNELLTEDDLKFNIEEGDFLKIPIYSESPDGRTLNDQVKQNSENISVKIETQSTRSKSVEYLIPNPGDDIQSAEFVLTEGDQNIKGNKTFENDVIVNGDLSVNGTLTFLNSENTQITDKLITLNKGGADSSAGNSGIEFEEDDQITGYIKQENERKGYSLKGSDSKELELDLSLLTDDRKQSAADADGIMVLRDDTGVAGQVAFYKDANKIDSDSSLFWNDAESRLGVGTSSPSKKLDVDGGARIRDLGAGVVKSDVDGNLSSSSVSLTADVSEILPVANGGTNSSTALNNNRIMVSSGGAIVEADALTDGQLLIGSTGAAPVAATISGTADQVVVTNGAGSVTLSLPQDIADNSDVQFNSLQLSLSQGSVVFAGEEGVLSEDNADFFWDTENKRLGLGTDAPSRTLDVDGKSLFRDDLKIEKGSANFEMKQASVSTTDATLTTIATVVIPSNSAVMIKAKIIGKRTGGTAGSPFDGAVYERTARFKNIEGTVTKHNLQSDYTSEDQSVFNGTISVLGTDAAIQVRGAANNNMDWSVTYEVSIL
jgi:hypothetical protein